MADAKRNVLSTDTLIPFGKLVGAGLALLSGALWLNTRLSDLKHGQEQVQTNVEQLTIQVQKVDEKIDSQFMDRLTFQQWCDLLQAKNPTLNIPVVR